MVAIRPLIFFVLIANAKVNANHRQAPTANYCQYNTRICAFLRRHEHEWEIAPIPLESRVYASFREKEMVRGAGFEPATPTVSR